MAPVTGTGVSSLGASLPWDSHAFPVLAEARAGCSRGSLLTPPPPTPLPRGLGVDSKPELQRVLEHRRRNQLIKKKKEELEAKRLQCPFEQELLRRQQRLNQVGGGPRPRPCFLQDHLLAQGGAQPAVTADEEAEPDEDWTQSPRLPASSLGHSLRCVTLDQWLPLSEPVWPNLLYADSDYLTAAL